MTGFKRIAKDCDLLSNFLGARMAVGNYEQTSSRQNGLGTNLARYSGFLIHSRCRHLLLLWSLPFAKEWLVLALFGRRV